jgi:hypothetical protein
MFRLMDDRRYEDDEVREIFERATRASEAGRPLPSSGGGLTLSDLKEIGREVGVEPDRIDEAARALDRHRGALPRRRLLGMPVSVGRVVDLPRPLTDPEWERLVAELRHTFDARGRVDSTGGLREWTNGNLHAYVEPTDSGHRLRLGTTKGGAASLTVAGIGGLALAAIMLAALLSGGTARELLGPVVIALLSGAALGSNVFGLPRWAAERERQMEYIAGRALELVGSGDEKG